MDFLALAQTSQKVGCIMMHISCDGCGKDLTEHVAEHFVVKIETYAKYNPADTDDELLTDHLDEMNDLLNATTADDGEPPPSYKKFRYDLCPSCQKRFLANPLAREAHKFNFSQN